MAYGCVLWWQVVMEMDTAGGVLPELRQEQQRQAAEEMTGLQQLWRRLGLEAEETVRLSDEVRSSRYERSLSCNGLLLDHATKLSSSGVVMA